MNLAKLVVGVMAIFAFNIQVAVADAGHSVHAKHEHEHGAACGHKAETHGDHTDYEDGGHHHKKHQDHWDECTGPEGKK